MVYLGSGQSKNRGFTLVEILVVVAVIGMLIAILLPTLSLARESTRRAVCATRLNQIGTAIMAYRAQHPRSYGLIEYNAAGAITDVNDNMISLAPSVPGLDTFICPSTRNRLSSASRLRAHPTSTTGDWSSYESYGHFDSGKVKRPSLCKGKEGQVWLVFDSDNPELNWNLSSADNHGPDGGNVLHADMHVGWVTGANWAATRFNAQRMDLE